MIRTTIIDRIKTLSSESSRIISSKAYDTKRGEHNVKYALTPASVVCPVANCTLSHSLVALDQFLSTHVRPQSLRHCHCAILVLIIL